MNIVCLSHQSVICPCLCCVPAMASLWEYRCCEEETAGLFFKELFSALCGFLMNDT